MATDAVEAAMSPLLRREVWLRPNTSDRQVLSDCQAGLYHVPPDRINPASVLDLGANIGITTAHYRKLWPDARIVSVEMDHENFRLLCVNAPDVIHVQAAVSDHDGQGFYRGTDEQSFRLEDPPLPMGARRLAAVHDLGALIDGYFGDRVDFVKMDIEGEEWRLLRNPKSWAKRVNSLLVELHDEGAPGTTADEWPAGRDGPSPLLAAGVQLATMAGFHVFPHTVHPHALWCVR